MITLFQIDKSGFEVFQKDYSISVVKNQEEVYGINLPQNLKDRLLHLFNTGQLFRDSLNSKTDRFRLSLRTHTAFIILLLEKAIKDEGFADKLNIQICNDFDGHFHEIKDMVYKHLSKIIPSLKPEDIIQAKFSKTSLVNLAAKNLREKNTKETSGYIIPKINIEELIKIIKK